MRTMHLPAAASAATTANRFLRALVCCGLLFGLALPAGVAAQETPPVASAAVAGAPAGQEAPAVTAAAVQSLRDPYKEQYRGYDPPYLQHIRGRGENRDWQKSDEEMRLSTEKHFFTLNVLNEDSRANALVEAGLKKESEGQFREALKIYQQVIEKFSDAMYRVSDHGVFVPVSQYCQRRILGFPGSDLDFYRQMYDARAREAFETARRQYSLLGLSDVVDSMLATSYGGPALLELGNAALDSGHYLAALEYFSTIEEFFPDKELRTPELALKMEYCRRMLGQKAAGAAGNGDALPTGGELSDDQRQRFDQVIATARYEPPPFHSQRASEPHSAADDYTLMPPSHDPLALEEPVWEAELPGSRFDFFVYSQPVVTENSVVYRHKNIVYCRSVLNGNLRWKNEMGGRATWQNWMERQYPQEDLLVQDGLVFTTVSKAGPSLVAFDEITGQLRWAYGPVAAANEEEARMRFESAPAGGPRTIFAGYVLDNIEGETHTDTEYGVIAFDSTTGRVHWRAPLCRLAPGKFAGGFAERRRNRVRSFTSPPLYHEGTVYYCTNAGAIVALDALSGRVKWLMRYPYYPEVHDATRRFGRGGDPVQYTRINFEPHRPMFWYNQRPLLIGEKLIVPPVDSNMLLCIDRRTGMVNWAQRKAGPGLAYVLGTNRKNELVLAHTGRNRLIRWHNIQTPGPVELLDLETGESLWQSPDLVLNDDQPVMKHYVYSSPTLHYDMNRKWFELAARPFMTSDGRVYATLLRYEGYPIYGWITGLGCVDVENRKIVAQRRYYSGEILARAFADITSNGPEELEAFEALPNKTPEVVQRIKWLKEVVADTVPQNEHGPFLPFSRISFSRHNVPFEVRMSPRTVQVVYNRDAVAQAVAKGDDPRAKFARAELAIADARLDEAARLLQECLDTISSEDLDFRAAINQQLYGVHQALVRRAIRAGRPEEELANVLGMSRTAGTLAEEIETLFAVAEAYERNGNREAAAQALRTIIATYGHHEYPVSPIAVADSERVLSAAREVMQRYRGLAEKTLFGTSLTRTSDLMEQGLPLYLSTVSPLEKTLTVRAGEFAAMRLMRLGQQDPDFDQSLRALAEKELVGDSEELATRLWEFPATPGAQRTLEKLMEEAAAADSVEGRKRLWQLADAARVGGLSVPEKFLERVSAPKSVGPSVELALPQQPREHDFADEEGAARLVLERKGDRTVAPNLLFLGARVQKRLDNKFLLTAMDLETGKVVWETEELRLMGKGQEPGFFTAFVHGDLVVVHGLYDVLAFKWKDGSLVWRYQVPFDFEIRHAMLSGDLLILSGPTETLALYVHTDSPAGEVAWQVPEMGDLYIDPYLRGDRIVSVRKLPFSVTVRYRATGKLIGRLDLPDLSLHTVHPLLENGPQELPAAHAENLLALTDAWYYILIDVDRLAIRWKRLIDNSDVTRNPAMRFALSPKYFSVLKEDYDQKAIYMLDAETGEVLWNTDPKNSRSPRPMRDVLIVDETAYGIEPHPGQGYYLVAREARSGKQRYREEVKGFQAKPEVALLPELFGGKHLVTRLADRQDFEVRVFDAGTGKPLHLVQTKGVGPYRVHGRVSTTIQNGRAVLLSKDKLQL